MKQIITLFLSVFIFNNVSGQSDCNTAIELKELNNWCSPSAFYTNEDTDVNSFPSPSCFTEPGYDVWFKFTAVARDINITVLGDVPFTPFGTLDYPEAVLYKGVCGGTFSIEFCSTDKNQVNSIELYKGGLEIGQEYFLRVQGGNRGIGTFQLCINNYNPVADYSSDCQTATILCNKASFVVHGVTGPGFFPLEMDDATCFYSNNQSNTNFETNSSWFKWRIKKSGTLVFTLTPLVPTDDLDFVLYRLPNQFENCADKEIVRCMAAGGFINLYPTPCHGPTGLSFDETDTSEILNCMDGQNNFLRYLDVEEDEVYVLAINNYTSQGNSFSIEFGGTAEFEGPQLQIEVDKTTDICTGDELTISAFLEDQVGQIVSLEWILNSEAEFISSETANPIQVRFNESGRKYITAVIENDLGCVVNHTIAIDIQAEPEYTVDIATPLCYGVEDGHIIINSSNEGQFYVDWNTGASTDSLINLSPGLYSVTISNGSACIVEDSFLLPEVEDINLVVDYTNALCAGGTNGRIVLMIDGPSPPYTVNWNDGNDFSDDFEKNNLTAGFYPISIRDSNGCLKDTILTISEIDIELDPNAISTIDPSCHGSKDGQILLDIIGGQAPYLFDWYNNGDFVSNNSLQDLGVGVYTIVIRDANGCIANLVLTLEDPPFPEIFVRKTQPICSYSSDGEIIIEIVEGNHPYTYHWANGTRDRFLTGLSQGVYNLTLTDSNGCVFDYPITLEAPQMNLDVIDIQHNLCYGDSIGLFQLMGHSDGRNIQFSIDGGKTYSGLDLFQNLQAGMFDIAMIDSRGCVLTEEVTIEDGLKIDVTLSGKSTIQLGESTNITSLITPFGDYNFTWSPEDSTYCFNCPNIRVSPIKTTTYLIRVENQNGCVGLDSITIFVEKFRKVYIPNIFSPNGDGVNDFFFPIADVEAENIKKIMIFNRWGALMYEEEDLDINFLSGWDGTFNSEPVNKGVYVYVIEILFKDGYIGTFSGDVTLFR